MCVATQTKRKTNRHEHIMRNMVTGTLAHWPCVQIERDHQSVLWISKHLLAHTHLPMSGDPSSLMHEYIQTHSHTSWHLHRPCHTSYCNSRGPPDVQTDETFIQMHKQAHKHTLAHLHVWFTESLTPRTHYAPIRLHPHTNTHMHREER